MLYFNRLTFTAFSLVFCSTQGVQKNGSYTSVFLRPYITEMSSNATELFLSAAKKFVVKGDELYNLKREYSYMTKSLFVHNNYRKMVLEYEKKLKAFNEAVVVPAWNYTAYAGRYDRDPVFKDNLFNYPENCPKRGCKPKECVNFENINMTHVPKFYSEENILNAPSNSKLPDAILASDKLTENTIYMQKLLWKSGLDYVKDYGPLQMSMLAHELNVWILWGCKHQQNIDVDVFVKLDFDPKAFEFCDLKSLKKYHSGL